MKRRKGTIWAMVISAALITAGLILSCGDDGDGNGGDLTCEDICEKFVDECEFFEGTVDDCVEECEDEIEDVEEEVIDVFECAVDTSCGYIVLDCFCKAICEKLLDCDFFDEEYLLYCMVNFGDDFLEAPFDAVIGETMEILEATCEELEE